MEDTAPLIEAELPKTPQGWAARWQVELTAARKEQKSWWERADKIIERYLDNRRALASNDETRLNLFTANTQTMEALLFGKTPKVDVARRFADSADDQARVAAEMLERILNIDIEEDNDTQTEAFRNALSDRLRAGLGNVRLCYEPQIGKKAAIPAIEGEHPAPEVPEEEVKEDEEIEVVYVYWKDQLWSPCRTFRDVRWWAFANLMSEEDFVERFGEKFRGAFTAHKQESKYGEDATKVKDPLARCEVWEIWDKETEKVYWFVEGYQETLDIKDDLLGLDNFWPFPRPMFANLTTSKLMPMPDYALAQDLYDEVDMISTRITLLERAIRVVGVYDKTNTEVARVINETSSVGNELIGVDSWAMFAEKGGMKGCIDWFPLEMVVNALTVLREYRTELIGLLYQITGMSDIMRGQASTQTTATEQAIKARFASVRVQTLQDEFARFCSDVQKLKAEIISKHFDPQTIIERSNVMRTPDAQLAESAVQLIKSPRVYEYRVTVNPDSVSLTDFAALKQERGEFAQTIATYFQGMLPLLQIAGSAGFAGPTVQFILNLGQQLVAGMHGSNEMEGVFDQFIAAVKQQAMQPQPPPPPDPKLQAAQVKAQAEMGKAHASQQQTQLDTQAHLVKTSMDMKQAQTQHQLDMAKMAMSIQSEEAKARAQALSGVNDVTKEGKT